MENQHQYILISYTVHCTSHKNVCESIMTTRENYSSTNNELLALFLQLIYENGFANL